MLRILHSLPRAHKLLLLPVATMVTVLGTHKLMVAFDALGENREVTTQFSLSQAGLPLASPAHTVNASQDTLKPAQPLLDATHQTVPLASLVAQEVVDISFISAASASNANAPLQQTPPEAAAAPPTDTQSEAKLDNKALHLAMQLPETLSDENYEAGGTSYEDLSADPLILNDGEVDLEQELAAEKTFVPEWETYTIQKGDTFAVMAERTLGLGYSEVMALLDVMPDKAALTRWRVGDNFDFKLDKDGNLLALRIMRNARNGYLIERNIEDKRFEVASFEKASEATQRLFSGTLNGSFAQSASATGLSHAEVAELSALLSKKLNFRRDARRGDQFQVLVEADMIEGKVAGSRILAAQYQGKKMQLTVVRNTADDRFYTPEGRSLDPAFNRYPINGNYRISSSFNLRRKHPVTGRISPHRGTDFAVRTGTPVNAPADGRVIKSTHQSLAGNYIVIRHDNGYKTRYMHLSKRLVSEGDRVAMGQKIALSGNTGRSTGPHLHYEVMVNNRQVDPMRVKLPDSQNLAGEALAAFKQESRQLLAKFESDDKAPAIARRASTPNGRSDDT